MLDKPFDQVNKEDIQSLQENNIPEAKTIEYKWALPGKSDNNKKEFLADISSFANASGGDIFFGIKEENGIPVEIHGLEESDIDNQKLRLENLIRDGIEPRIPGIHIQAIGGFEKGTVLHIRISKSWITPHMVTFQNTSRFFSRHSGGKYQLDVTEIRSAFLLSEALPERIKKFRDERMAKIVSDETPIPLRSEGRLALHLFPLVAFSDNLLFDISDLQKHATNLDPISAANRSHRPNIDGIVTFTPVQSGSGSRAYCQAFRTGRIEAVYADLLSVDRDGNKILRKNTEKYLIEAVQRYLYFLRQFDIFGPLYIFVSIMGASGAYLPRYEMYDDERVPIDRDMLICPDVLLDTNSEELGENAVAQILKPVFDSIWNACGYERSFNFDEEGNWIEA